MKAFAPHMAKEAELRKNHEENFKDLQERE
jgi:hypothetical protein